MVNDDSNKVRQSQIECAGAINTTETYITIEELAEIYGITQSLTYWSASRVEMNKNVTLYPGGKIKSDYSIFDEYGNNVKEYQYPITIGLVYDKFDINSVIYIDENGVCEICDSGFYVEGINIDDSGSFIINTFVEDNLLMVDDMNISIIDCPAGFGTSNSTQQCSPCNQGTFSLRSNRKECEECDDNLRGVTCLGSNIIVIDFSYWMRVDNYSSIISSDCPSKHCCSDLNGCEYINGYQQLCALNRDPATPLCGQCLFPYSEIFGSNQCADCKGSNHIEYILIPLILCILAALYFLYFDQPSTQTPMTDPNEIDDEISKLIRKDQLDAINIMFFKVLWYFFQSILLILLLGAPDAVFYTFPFLEIFNLSIDYSSGNSSSGYCFYDGMTTLSKILLGLLPAAMLLFIILIPMVFICCGITLEIKGRKPRYITALFRALLIGIGAILSVFFKLLACRQIDDEISVHFYYGSHSCYDGTWYIALFVAIVIVILFTFLWYKLYKLPSSTRQSKKDNPLYSLVKPYNEKYWYWEFVTLSRRFILSLFTTIFYDSDKYWNVILSVILMTYLSFHVKMKPFKHQRSNTLETVCIIVLFLSLSFITLTEMNHTSTQSQTALSTILIIGIFTPILMFLYQFVRYIIYASCWKEQNVSHQRISKLVQRTPKSQQNVLQKFSENVEMANIEVVDSADDHDGNAQNLNTSDLVNQDKKKSDRYQD